MTNLDLKTLGSVLYVKKWAEVAALLLVLLLTGCGPFEETPPAPSVTVAPPVKDSFKATVKLGGIFDLSGPSSSEGRDYAAGALAYTDFLNSKGGANGYRLELKAANFAAKAPVAIEQYQSLVKEGAVGFLAWDTADTLAISRQLHTDHVPLLSASYDEELVRDVKQQPYTFMIAPSYADQIKLALLYTKRTRYDQTRITEPTAVGYLYSDDEFGRFPYQTGRDYAASKGISWFHEGVLQARPNGSNLLYEANRLRNARPEYTLVQAKPNLVAEMLKTTRAADVPTTFIGLNYTATPELPQQVGKAAEGYLALAVLAYPDDQENGLTEMRSWLAQPRSVTTPGPTPLVSINQISLRFIQGWATMKVLAEGVRQALIANPNGLLSGEKVKEGLENIRQLDMGGLTGPLSFSPTRHKGSDAARVIKIENGKWKQVAPYLSLAALEFQDSQTTPIPAATPSPTRKR